MKIIEEKHRNLLINSTICDESKELKNLLIEYEKGLTINQIEKVKDKIGDLYYKLKSKEIIKKMIEDAGKEWIQEKPVGIVEKPCDLCKNIKSKEKFIIKNRINNNKLLVGSSCIDKFSEIERSIKGEKLADLIKYTGSKEYIYDRLAKFNKMYEGGKEIIDNWKNFYDSFEILFPAEIENSFENINKKARKFYKDYKNANIPEDELVKFGVYIKEFEYIKKKMLEFEEKNINNKFLCTKEIADELRKRKLNNILKHIKDSNAIIEAWQIKYIGNTKFIKQFYSDIESVLKKDKVKLLEIENEKIVGEIINEEFNKIKLEMSTSSFIRNFYYLISKEKVESKKNFIITSNILKEKSNIFKFINIIAKDMEIYKYYFHINDDMYDAGYLEVYKKNKFTTIEVKKILENKNLFMNKSFEKIIQLIKALEWDDVKNKHKYDIGNVGKFNSGTEYIYTSNKKEK